MAAAGPGITGAPIVSPIVIDLDGDGNELIDASGSNARFDMDGDGKPDETAWFGSGDAILFLDRDGNGTVTNAKEFSFVQDSGDARSSLDGLKAFDTNQDGKLSAADSDFGKFRLWQDRNGDGVATAAEITTLTASNIASLSLTGTATGRTPTAGSAVAINTGQFTRADGTQGMFSDAAFTYYSGSAGAAARIEVARQSFDRKSKKYHLTAQGGQLFVSLTRAKGDLAPGSGLIGPATLLSFKGRTIGMLAPIILDLDGDGVEMVARGKSRATFDMDGDGHRDDTGWIGKGDGFLVIDRDNDGLITSAAELSFLTEKPGARSDLDALSALDSNRDRKIDATDLRFGELKVWVDANRNGVTDAGELKTLQELNIASIDLAAAATQQKANLGDNILLATGSFTLNDGTVRSLGDAALAYKPSRAGAAAAVEGVDPAEFGLDLAALTAALRAGLDGTRLSIGAAGLSLGLPTGVDPFEYFANLARHEVAADAAAADQDLAHLPETPQGGIDVPDELPAGAPSTELIVARMVQTMASFGHSQGEGDWQSRHRDTPKFEYFA
jgi:hypothetical protein